MLLSKIEHLLFFGIKVSHCFNPYFSGCFSLSLFLHSILHEYLFRFQSLFFWMLLSKLSPASVFFRLLRGKFQSLFFWMLLSKSAAAPQPSQQHGFNPYFSGCFSLRISLTAVVFVAEMFQSLFFWMLLSKPICARRPHPWTRAVSILIFLDASL